MRENLKLTENFLKTAVKDFLKDNKFERALFKALESLQIDKTKEDLSDDEEIVLRKVCQKIINSIELASPNIVEIRNFYKSEREKRISKINQDEKIEVFLTCGYRLECYQTWRFNNWELIFFKEKERENYKFKTYVVLPDEFLIHKEFKQKLKNKVIGIENLKFYLLKVGNKFHFYIEKDENLNEFVINNKTTYSELESYLENLVNIYCKEEK